MRRDTLINQMDEQRKQILDSVLMAFVIAILVFVSIFGCAQSTSCGFDYLDQRIEANYYGARSNNLLIIPVVIHVIHKESEEIGVGANISDAQVISAIHNFNEVAATNVHGDIMIRLCLAKTDPQGNPTTGIDRHTWTSLYESNGLLAQSSGETAQSMAAEFSWPKQDYYNIYSVTEIDNNNAGGGVQGYAYFPTFSQVDGTYILYNAVGVVGNLKSYTNQNKTFVHELGHAFGLYHTFQSTNNCDVESNCNIEGDRLCDTAPMPNQNCYTTTLCPDAPVNNYMSYGSQNCKYEFTADGAARMNATILNSPYRQPLLESDVCASVNEGCTNDLCVNAIEIGCEPVEFTNVTCNIFDFDDNNMSRLVGNCTNSNLSQCGGNNWTAYHADMWFSFVIDTPGYYDLNTFTNYSCVNCGSGTLRLFLWHTYGSCEDAQIVYSLHCPQSVCWAGNIGEYLGDEAGYYEDSYSMMMEFLVTGQYYVQVDAWGWGPNHPDFEYSMGSGTISICPVVPLSLKPTLDINESLVTWDGVTSTDWTLFHADFNGEFTEVVRTDEKEFNLEGFEFSEGYNYFVVAGSTGFSNTVSLDVRYSNRAEGRYDILGREGVKIWIK